MTDLRQQLLNTSHQMVAHGLNRGTSGNASVRTASGMLITPSALPVSAMTPADMIEMSLAGEPLQAGKPSSEWRMHGDILQARTEINAVLHTHSPYATTISCLRKDVTAVHYMIAIAGGDNIACAPYSLFGEQDLSNHALIALNKRKACLLAHHGMIALGDNLADALAVAVEVEFICEIYWRILQVEEPQVLSPQQMHEVILKFKEYKKSIRECESQI